MEFLGFMTFEGHFGNCNFGMPSQSLVFPINDIALVFLKIPLIGTSPSKLLNKIFKYSRKGRFSIPSGMDPNRLFCETSRCLRPF